MKSRKATLDLAWRLQSRYAQRLGGPASLRPLLPRWVDADDYPQIEGFVLPMADRAASRARGFDRWLVLEDSP